MSLGFGAETCSFLYINHRTTEQMNAKASMTATAVTRLNAAMSEDLQASKFSLYSVESRISPWRMRSFEIVDISASQLLAKVAASTVLQIIRMATLMANLMTFSVKRNFSFYGKLIFHRSESSYFSKEKLVHWLLSANSSDAKNPVSEMENTPDETSSLRFWLVHYVLYKPYVAHDLQ